MTISIEQINGNLIISHINLLCNGLVSCEIPDIENVVKEMELL